MNSPARIDVGHASVSEVLRRAAAPLRPGGAPAEARATRILLVDDDPAIADLPAIQMLRQQPFAVERAPTLGSARAALEAGGVDLVLLDAEAEGLGGLPFCLEISQDHGVPVVIFAARAEPLETVAAFEFGARDCIAKSAHPLEVLARTRAALRHAAAPGRTTPCGGPAWAFDPTDGRLTGPTGAAIYLTPGSIEIFMAFAARPGVLMDRPTLARLLFGSEQAIATRALDVRVTRLRRMLDSCDGAGRMIRTRRTIGYLFDGRVERAGGQTLTIVLDS